MSFLLQHWRNRLCSIQHSQVSGMTLLNSACISFGKIPKYSTEIIYGILKSKFLKLNYKHIFTLKDYFQVVLESAKTERVEKLHKMVTVSAKSTKSDTANWRVTLLLPSTVCFWWLHLFCCFSGWLVELFLIFSFLPPYGFNNASLILWESFAFFFSFLLVFSPLIFHTNLCYVFHTCISLLYCTLCTSPLFCFYSFSLKNVQQPEVLVFSVIPLISSQWISGFPHLLPFLFCWVFSIRLLLCFCVSHETVSLCWKISISSVLFPLTPVGWWPRHCSFLFLFLSLSSIPRHLQQYCWLLQKPFLLVSSPASLLLTWRWSEEWGFVHCLWLLLG